MPLTPPTNTTPGTALDITEFPYNISQDATGLTELWLKYVAPACPNLIKIVLTSPTADYFEVVVNPTDPLVDGDNYAFTDHAIQVPMELGITYYLKISDGFGGTLTGEYELNIYAAPGEAAVLGSIFINNDVDQGEATIISSTTGEVKQFVNNFPSGEAGEVLPSGIMIFSEAHAVGDLNSLFIYDAQFNLLATITSAVAVTRYVAGNMSNAFYYVFDNWVPGNTAVVKKVSDAGVDSGFTWNPAVPDFLKLIGVNSTETILYYFQLASTLGATQSNTVKRWDLSTDLALSDLVGPPSANERVQDFFVLADDTILVAWYNSVTSTPSVIRYSTAGAILNTYTQAVGGISSITRLARAIDDPTSFWVWLHRSGNISNFQNIRVSDGTVLANITGTWYEAGDGGSEDLTDEFGHSLSCPFVVLREAIPATPCDIPGTSDNHIFVLTPDRRSDNFTGADEAIPSPFFITSLLGD